MRKTTALAATLLLVTTVLSFQNCSSKSSGSSSSDASAGTSAISIMSSSAMFTPGMTATITVTGGSGSYGSATASQGSISQTSPGVFTYLVPSSPTNSTVQINVTDSAGTVGTGYFFIDLGNGGAGLGSGTGTTAVSTCTGLYDMDMGGLSSVLDLIGDTSGNITGYISVGGYVYPLLGTCSLSSGSISFTNLSLNIAFSGTISVSSSDTMSISGTVSTSNSSYDWSAQSRGLVSDTTWPSPSCEGNYNATIAGNAGTLVLVEDGSGNLGGYLYLQGYYYAFSGTCPLTSGGTISLTNLTTGSPYSGTVTFSGSSSVQMSGTFTLTSGAGYTWSASK